MGETTFYNRDKMWFGTTDYMQWIDTPNTGADVSPLGFSADATLLNGGGYVRNSWDSHKTYQFAWGQSASLALSHAINAYRNGSWGRGLIYFHDPMTYGTNILPKRWADPSMAVNYEAAPLIPDVYPTSSPAAPGLAGLPVTTATYPLTTGYSSQTNNSEHFIPIPPDMTLLLGASYTGGGKLYIRVDGNAPVDLPNLDPSTGSAVNVKVTGQKAYLGIRNTTGAPSSISIQGITARLADSARVPSYMGQPVTNLLVNPSFETSAGTVDLVTNLLTNPSFEGAGAATVVRTNYWRDPMFTSTSLYGASGGSATLSVSGGRITTTATGTNVGRCGLTHTIASQAAGTYYIGFDVQSNSANFTGTRVYLYDSASATIRATLTGAAPTSETRLELSGTATGAFDTVFLEFTGTAIASGNAGTFGRPYISNIPGPFFSGSTQAIISTNLAINPNAVTATGFANNNASTWTLSRNVTAPSGNPQGITTAASSILNGAQSTISLLSMYNMDGLVDTASFSRMVGAWVYANAGGYQARFSGAPGGFTNPIVPLPANTWTWVTGQIASLTYAGMFVEKQSGQGNAGASDVAYVTGVTVFSDGTAPDKTVAGSVAAPAGYASAWSGAANASQTTLWDSDFSVRWQGTANASPSELTGVGVLAITGSTGVSAIQSTRWVKDGTRSLRLIPTSTNSTSYVIFTGAGSAGDYTLKVSYHQEGPITGATWSARGRPYLSSPQSLSPTTAPNAAGDTDFSFTATLTSGPSVVLPHGGTIGSGDVWYDMGTLVSGTYTGPAFNGNTTSTDPDMVYVWTGTPNVSTSALRGTGVSNYVATGGSLAIQSSIGVRDGIKSARIIPQTTGDTSIQITQGGLTVGQTYTILGYVTLTTPITASSAFSLGFWVSGAPLPTLTYSSSASNSPGTYEVRATFVANATSHNIRFYNGSASSSDNVYWDTVALFAGNYAGPWGSGTFTTPINIDEGQLPWYSGEGHSGVRFVGTPTVINYNGVNGGQIGLSCTLKEVGAWA